MGATATLRTAALQVDPGGQVSCEITVRNNGQVVDQFTLSVLGDAAGWATIDPPSLNLFPGDEGTARVWMRPPRSSDVRAGVIPFGVRVASREDPAGTAIEEGTVEVTGYAETFAELAPRTSRGRSRGVHDLAFDNRGNTRLQATIEASDPDRLLSFEVQPPAFVAEPNSASFARVTVRPVHSFWRGPAKSIPFSITVRAPGAAPATVDGTMLQEAILPAWLPKLLMFLVGLGVLGAIMLVVLFKQVNTSAQGAARNEVARFVPPEMLNPSPGAGPTLPPKPTDDAGGGATGGGALGAPFDKRLGGTTTTFAEGQTAADTYTVEEGKTLSIVDVVLGNPAGDSGTMRIMRGNAVLLEVSLDNFRDLDYHFTAPLTFAEDQRLVLQVQCTNAGGNNTNCTPSAYFGGYLK